MLEEFTKQGRGLLRYTDIHYAHEDFNQWVEDVARWLSEIAPESGLSADWASLAQSMLIVGDHSFNIAPAWGMFHRAVRERLKWLAALGRSMQARKGTEGKQGAPVSPSGKVFIVHGRDDAARESVARFLDSLGLKAVILREQPNAGRTIIEKFTDYSDVSFAVVLLTEDDVGRLSSESSDKEKPRARQNVILELGFFLGKLGRKNVCALYEAGVEIPSDYHGVIFLELDAKGSWKLDLARELKAAGIPFDMNRIVEDK